VKHKLEIKKAEEIIDHVATAVSRWTSFAEEAKVPKSSRYMIGKTIGG